MAVTSGFYNSLNGDRRYSAEQMSALFDGLITDGVFASVGTAFEVKAGSGDIINIGIGRSWFNSTWLYNDAVLPVSVPGSELLQDRIDAVVIEVNHDNSVRDGDIKVVKGTPSDSPERPTLTKNDKCNQYPLAYVERKAGVVGIKQSDITNMIGTSECPYVTGIIQVQNIDKNVAQWEAQWLDWKTKWEQWEILWDEWYGRTTTELNTDTEEWFAAKKAEFTQWFYSLESILSDDAAVNLSNKILELEQEMYILATERVILDELEDSNGNAIADSNNTEIITRTVFGGSSGGSFNTGPLNMSGNRISGLPEPLSDTDAATKGYVDSKVTSKLVETVLEASKWTGEDPPYKYVLDLPGVTETSNQEYLAALDITPEQLEVLQDANIQDDGQENSIAYLKACGFKPEIDLPIRVIMRGDI